MALSAIGVVHLVEQKFVMEVGAQSLRGGDADIDFIAKKRGSHRVPGRDVDQDLHLGMPVVEPRYGGIETFAHQAGYDLDRDPASYLLGEISEPLGNASHHRIQGSAGLGNEHAFVGQHESAGSAPAQRHAELGFEALEGETECRLLTPHRPPGAADSAGLGDLVECLQEIPIDIPRKTLRGVDHSLPQIDCGMMWAARRPGPGNANGRERRGLHAAFA